MGNGLRHDGKLWGRATVFMGGQGCSLLDRGSGREVPAWNLTRLAWSWGRCVDQAKTSQIVVSQMRNAAEFGFREQMTDAQVTNATFSRQRCLYSNRVVAISELKQLVYRL